jgi:hypothetical protein
VNETTLLPAFYEQIHKELKLAEAGTPCERSAWARGCLA